MSRRPAKVTEAEIRRAIRAVDHEGGKKSVRIAPDGSIWIVPADGAPLPEDGISVEPNEWDAPRA